jgi:hypothetical protein
MEVDLPSPSSISASQALRDEAAKDLIAGLVLSVRRHVREMAEKDAALAARDVRIRELEAELASRRE